MAKPLTFDFEGDKIEFEMIKVDRSRLYGFKELEVLDEEGKPCELTTLADDGKTLIGKGGTGIGYLTVDGNWVEKAELVAVNLEGQRMTPVTSSFAAPISLSKKTTIDEYLNHIIRLAYMLEPKTVCEKLFVALRNGSIFQFDYSYRGGLEPDAGFLLMNEENEIFFLVGSSTAVEYKSLQQVAAVTDADGDSDEEGADDDELMDFGMI